MKSAFLICDRETSYLMPPSVKDWLPEKHLAKFVVDIIDQIDVSEIEKRYSSLGRKAYSVRMMLGLLFYGYITGIYSSRKIALATHEVVPFRYIAANHHPDYSSIANFRKLLGKDFEKIALQILLIASEMGILNMGTVATDGSKVKANASKHKALSWEYANKLEVKLKNEIAELMKKADEADQVANNNEIDIPEELARREKRLEIIKNAQATIEKRAKERFERENEAYLKRVAERDSYEKKTGKKKVESHR